MLEALLTLMVLASGPSGHDNINAGNSNYGLELAFEQATVDASQYEAAIALQMAQANERVAEAQAAHGNGDAASAQAALNAYDHLLGDLAYSLVAADAINDEALLAQLDAELAAHNDALAQIAPEQQEGTAEPEGEGGACTRSDHPMAEKIAEAAGLTYDQVLAMFCAEGEAKLGFGQVMMAAKIAQEAGVPLEQVLAMRAEGKGWGQIKRELGVTQPGGKFGKKCTDKNPKDGINDETGEPCPPKGNGNANGNGNAGGNGNGSAGGNGNGNGNANGNGNGGGNGNGKNCRDKDPKDGINDETGEPCPPKDDDDDEQEDDGSAEAADEPGGEATVEPTQQP